MRLIGKALAFLACKLAVRVLISRPPDYMIPGPEDPYMRRWYVIPRNRWCNIYLHNILRSDDDRALHDHPWWSLSLTLKGKMLDIRHSKFVRSRLYHKKEPSLLGRIFVEYEHRADRFWDKRFVQDGSLVVRRAREAHRLELVEGPVWTLFITGPRIREWGFWCPNKGWVYWEDFEKKECN